MIGKVLQWVFFACILMPLPCQGSSSDSLFFNLRREQRRIWVHTVKSAVAKFDEKKRTTDQKQNTDEKLYADLRGSYGKGLSHLNSGFIDPEAFQSLVIPLETESCKAFNAIQLGLGRRQVNPQGSLVFSLDGNDGWINAINPTPAFASDQTAGEMVELYWTALVRDVPFNEFNTNPTVAMAIQELNTLTDFRGPKIAGQVTPQTFLRGNAPGELDGPYISQFLYQPIPIVATTLVQEQTVPLPGIGNDFNTTFADWFTVVDGGSTGAAINFDPTQRFLRNPRDLGEYVHKDVPGIGAYLATLLLNSYGPAALDTNNPYLNNPTQEGFVTFGISQILAFVMNATQEGLKAAWYQKWQVNRRLRPEEYGFYLQTQKNGQPLGIPAQLADSNAAQQTFNTFGSYFLPLAYPEGSPTHPSYPAGHATFCGAAITVLKAFFNEEFIIPNPVQPDVTNTNLIPFPGTLTVGGELNKLASNIALGRDHAGVHYRSDGYCGMLLGEAVAIDILNNDAFLFNEEFEGYHLTKFDGTPIIVGGKRKV